MMQSSESFERVWESLARAASCSRELGVMTNLPAWNEVAKQFLLMRQKAKVMYKSPALNEFQVQSLVTEMEMAQKAASMMRG